MRRHGLVWLFIISILAACSKTPSYEGDGYETLYVGSSNGLHNSVFSTVGSALETARKKRAQGVDVEIVLSDGVYYLDEPISIDASLSGRDAMPFVIRAENARKAILSGSTSVTAEWMVYSDDVWVTSLVGPNFDSLFVDGVPQVRARYPNFDPSKNPFNGYSSDAISPARVTTWSNPQTGIFHALHDGRWGGWHYNITGRDADGNVKFGDGIGNNRPSEPHPDFRYVENIFEELDAPGEWFFDEAKKKLYLYPLPGTDLRQAMVEISRLESIIQLRGTPDRPIRNIEIQDLGFTGTKMTFLKTNEPLLRSDWMVYRGGAIFLEGTENSFVRGSEFKDLGGNAIFFSGYNKGSGATGNKITDIGASGISVVGRPEAVRSASFTYLDFVELADMDQTPGPKSDVYPADILVEDNLIAHIGRVEKQVAGVQIAMAARVTVENNSIYDMPRAGINIGDGTWGGHILRGNDVFDTVLETGDHGAFNSWGRDRFWHPDRVVMDQIAKDHPDLIFADAIEPVLIEGNRWQSDHGWDIDLDDGSSNYIIRNNLCLSGGLKLREGFRRIVENNVLLNNSFHPHVWFDDSGDVFQHNIVMTDYKEILVNDWGDKIDWNLFPTESALAEAQTLGNDHNSLFGDANFLDPENGDFRVSDESPAKEIGFENFPMEFGVRSAWLKAEARTPPAPELFLSSDTTGVDETFDVLGATVRRVATEGDKSAYGLPSISGVIIESIQAGSIAEKGGLRARDVIIGAFDEWNSDPEKIHDVAALRSSNQARRWMGILSFVIVRNQVEERVVIDLTI